MDIFIGNLPMQATLEDLRCFFGGLELKASFDCRRAQTPEQECFFYLIARTRDEVEGLALIERLNGQPLLDKNIVARPLITRQSDKPPLLFHEEDRRQGAGVAIESLPLFVNENEQGAIAQELSDSKLPLGADRMDKSNCYAGPDAPAQ